MKWLGVWTCTKLCLDFAEITDDTLTFLAADITDGRGQLDASALLSLNCRAIEVGQV